MKKKVLKIAWVIVTCLAFLASCARMDSNIIRVHAEEAEPVDDLADWQPYLEAMETLLAGLGAAPLKIDAIMIGMQIAISQTVPLAVSQDITVFNGITNVIGDYNYLDESGNSTYHLCNIGMNSHQVISEVGYQYNLVTYPSGSTAFARFGETGRIWAYPNNSGIDITGSGFSGFGYTVPYATTTNGFEIWYGGGSSASAVHKSYNNSIYPEVLCTHWASCFGHDFENQYNNWFGTEHAFLFPEVDENMASYMDTNDYLDLTYKKFEEDFDIEFEYEYPELVPVGTLLPDGSIAGGGSSGGDDITVNVEFPTYYVPDNPEPETFPLEIVPEVAEHEAEEIPEDAFLGLDFWWDCGLLLISLFGVSELVILILWTGLICFLLWR